MDEEVPPRVLAAEERRRIREASAERWTPGEAAVIKSGALDARVPGAEPLTPEEEVLAEEELARLGRLFSRKRT